MSQPMMMTHDDVMQCAGGEGTFRFRLYCDVDGLGRDQVVLATDVQVHPSEAQLCMAMSGEDIIRRALETTIPHLYFDRSLKDHAVLIVHHPHGSLTTWKGSDKGLVALPEQWSRCEFGHGMSRTELSTADVEAILGRKIDVEQTPEPVA